MKIPSTLRGVFIKAGQCLAISALGGCALHPDVPPLPQAGRKPATVSVDPETGEHVVHISVLTYNVAGLPWPIRSGTRRAMARIRTAMDKAFAEQRPDILLLQEAFIPAATRLPGDVGYRNFVRGPTRLSRSTLELDRLETGFLKGRRRLKGERFMKVVNGGLVLGTDHRVEGNVVEPFRRRSCAGFDCLSNKGVMLTTIRLPDVPEPLYILNTHLNSRGSTGVSDERSLYAHQQQAREIREVLDRDWRGQGPLIYAGDFNARNAPDRFEFKDDQIPGEWAHRYCHENRAECVVTMSWDSDEPWMDTQDLQGYADGPRISVRPLAIMALFDAPVDGRPLSDHDALLVLYRLGWTPDPADTEPGKDPAP